MVGRAWLPLNLRRILESIPWGVLQDFYKKQAQNETRKRVTYSDSIVLIGSEAVGVVLLLLDDLGLVQGLDGHLFIFNKESKSKFSYIFTIIKGPLIFSPYLFYRLLFEREKFNKISRTTQEHHIKSYGD